MNKTAILLSGGMDSISLAFWKRPSYAITIDYGQAAAETEIRTSSIIAKELQMEHHVIRVDCSNLGSGDLINQEKIDISPSPEWWPYRNQLLITLACMKAVSIGVLEVMIASVKSDEFHKDGTEKFYNHIADLVRYQEGEIKVSCPCINLTTIELIQLSKIPSEILFWAHSCHKSNIPCCNCRGCNKYAETVYKLDLIQ